MPHDPTLYLGTAVHYARGRPRYSRSLVATLAAVLGLDGSGRLLDAGCGPGILAVDLAPLFAETIGLDPDPGMLAEAARRAGAAGLHRVRWVQAVAEDLPRLDLGRFRVVAFGQSFHWTDRERVAALVYDLLEPGGALVIVNHAHEGRPQPEGPGHPPIPHEAIRALIRSYLGDSPLVRREQRVTPEERHEDVLARTPFGRPAIVFAPGRPDIVQDVDGVLDNILSTSFAAPHLFGERLDEFRTAVRAELEARSPDGTFWDWPGDTEIIVARRPA